jgi:DNA-binding response OmpR family regulator
VPHVLLAADADWVIDEVKAALVDRVTSLTICRQGQDVVPAALERRPDLAVLDLQIGNMGGMAVCMELHLEESSGKLDHVNVLMLLDRKADIHLARRSGAEGWLIKPLDALRLHKAAAAVLEGGQYREGVPAEPRVESRPDSPAPDDATDAAGDGDTAAGEPASTR